MKAVADFLVIDARRLAALRVLTTSATVVKDGTLVRAGNGGYYDMRTGAQLSRFNPASGPPLRLIKVRGIDGTVLGDFRDFSNTRSLIAGMMGRIRRRLTHSAEK